MIYYKISEESGDLTQFESQKVMKPIPCLDEFENRKIFREGDDLEIFWFAVRNQIPHVVVCNRDKNDQSLQIKSFPLEHDTTLRNLIESGKPVRETRLIKLGGQKGTLLTFWDNVGKTGLRFHHLENDKDAL